MSLNPGSRLLGKVHGKVVHRRRIAVLAQRLAAVLSPATRLLDVGCGDGRLAALLRDALPGLDVQGVEVLPRNDCAIPCRSFDGSHLPFPDDSFDCCLFVDVLHHTKDPQTILRDACRVSREFLVIKDHLSENVFDQWTLRLMDWVGNRPYGVALPYAYLSRSQWQALYDRLGLRVERSDSCLPLYPAPFASIFGRSLHFISLLKKQA
jgi:SAM-dependent methyltransferase